MEKSLSVSVPRPAFSDLSGSPYSLGTPQDIDAAIAMQKTYRGYRVRRQLADCAILAKEYGWWNVIEGVDLRKHLEVNKEQDNPVRRWMRAGKKAAKLGRGLSKDETARQLAFQHWLEAIDARHRYGHNLHKFYDVWLESGTNEPFFFWLDAGEGRQVNETKGCSRAKLLEEQISYLGPRQRKEYEAIILDGKLLYKKTGQLIDTTTSDDKCIFVMCTTGRIYVGQKKKGKFQHSSFLAGGAAKAAGRLAASNGIITLIEAHSGHYRPTEEDFKGFLYELESRGVDLSTVKIDYASREMAKRMKSKKKEAKGDDEEEGASIKGDSVSSMANKFVSALKELATPRKPPTPKPVFDLSSPKAAAAAGAAPVEAERKQEHNQEQKICRKRPSKLEIKKQKSFSSSGWCSENGARLFSLSRVPHDLRRRVIDNVCSPGARGEISARCREFGPFTMPLPRRIKVAAS